jgi:S1-C subfamily serine protease
MPVIFYLYLKNNRCLCYSFFFVLAVLSPQPGSALASISEAVVKIYTITNFPSYHEPWQMQGQNSTNGSGCIIDGDLILTNAHVVSNSMFIQVRRAGVANKYHATVKAIDYESDLAILSVEKKEFFKGIEPLAFGNLAKVRDRVAVYGFPDGGDKLSITEGVVSRIDHVEYAYSGALLLTCQIDAPINSGNSGGPVIYGNKIVGVAFQGMGGSYENIGYMIPTPIVRHFLDDITDGKVNGFPTLGILMQKLENPDMRRYYKLDGRDNGILVNKLYVHSPSKGVLYPGDVILEIEATEIANDGTIEFRPGQRTYFGYIIQQKQIGDALHLKILRNGIEKQVTLRMNVPLEANRLVPFEHEKKPRYYIYGGLVFEPLTLNYLQEFSDGYDWVSFAPVTMVDYYANGEKKSQQEEIIVLTKVLADNSNVGFHDFANVIITEVNEIPLQSFNQFVKILKKNRRKFIKFKTKSSLEITLHQDTVKKYLHSILKKYQISSQQSKNLKEL